MAVTNLNKYLTMGAIQGFTPLSAPIQAFSYVVKPGASSLNDVVRVPYAQNLSSSFAFNYSSGYSNDGNTISGQAVTMNNLLYQRIALSDSDLALLNEEALISIGAQCGRRLAADFVSASIASVVSTGNYATQAAYSSSAYSSSIGITNLDNVANTLAWPDGERALICGTTLWNSLLNNPSINQAYAFGSSDPVQFGKLKDFFGFSPYKVSFALPNIDTGFAVNPNGILVANGYHAPTDQGTQYMTADQIVIEGTGLTVGFRQFYVPLLATSYRVFDVLGGCAVGNANGVIHIK